MPLLCAVRYKAILAQIPLDTVDKLKQEDIVRSVLVPLWRDSKTIRFLLVSKDKQAPQPVKLSWFDKLQSRIYGVWR